MTNPVQTDPNATTSGQLLDAINVLEANTKQNIQTRRTSNRVGVNCPVYMQPGNSSDRTGVKTKGICRDVSTSGCRLVMPESLRVGDIYLVELELPDADAETLFGRCVRCHMLREDKFECGISFLSPFAPSGVADITVNSLDLELN